MALCASCKNRVEDGAVQCWSCGARLDLPGAFLQVVGWVTVACSSIPFGIALVTTLDKEFAPLFIACGTLVAGVTMILAGKVRSKSVPPTVIEEPSVLDPGSQA